MSLPLTVNGVAGAFEAETLADVFRIEARAQGLAGPEGVAIALNGRVVRRPDWDRTPVRAGDRVEIVRALQGG